MSKFFFEDICALKDDLAILGEIALTWSDTDSSTKGLLDCYVHKDLPLKVRKAWFDDEKLTPGYVIIAFIHDFAGYCLLPESSLQLIDRSFVAGDVVKKKLSDAQSGTVMSTSLMCSLQPLYSENDFLRQRHPPIQGHTPSHDPHSPRRAGKKTTVSDPKLIHGFPPSTDPEVNELADSAATPSNLLQVPASELKFWNNYREGDTLIYKGWIGMIRSVYDEVTVRLINGSVVVVQNSDELEEPYWIAGTSSSALVKRLDRAGYYRHSTAEHPSGVGVPDSTPAEPCYPGQYVQTKKGNLRCGRWKFGAYDPAIMPRGIVVDVRSVQAEVRWLSPIAPQGNLSLQPSTLLVTDELESGDIIVYDRSKLPKQPVASTLANASYSPDTGFGHRVRFKDPIGAACKYGSASGGTTNNQAPVFDRVPRAATQGFDMNVLEVVATATKVMILWQDCSITEEDSTQLFPYLNPDENDVWPGQKVSYIPDEEKLGDNVPIIRLHKVGVVQSVDAQERIARIRWFEGTEIDIDEEEKASQYSASKYGKLNDDVAEVPLYDIAGHEALAMNICDLVTIAPGEPLSLTNYVGQDPGSSSTIDPDGDVDMEHPHSGSTSSLRVPQPSLPGPLTASLERARRFLGLARDDAHTMPQDSSLSLAAECVGEVIDLSLDGEIVVRLGASSEVRDIKLPVDLVTVIAPADLGSSDYSDDDSYYSNSMSVSNEETDYETDQESVRAVDISVEYEGGEKPRGENDDDDDEMWATDDEDVEVSSAQETIDDAVQVNNTQPDGREGEELPDVSSDINIPVSSSDSSLPTKFSVLEDEAPSDHHFFASTRPLTSEIMRRIMREHKIMRSSLPDGIFVRSWEDRLDLLRVMIVGPSDTPYEFAPFVVDLHFGLAYPTSSPDAYFHSWTGGLGRINPNLYEDGKICLSLLGTWDGDERNEEWSPQTSTVLQILVSLMGLVLVKEPYFSKCATVKRLQSRMVMT